MMVWRTYLGYALLAAHCDDMKRGGRLKSKQLKRRRKIKESQEKKRNRPKQQTVYEWLE
jgi:hypothetical protein